jgi:RND family efflux transporter MFP subunit
MRQATVSAQTGGNVLELKVRAGDRVKAGQALARIDERNATAGLAQSDAGVAQAEAQLRQARLQMERNRELRAQGYLSQAALDQADNEFKAAQAGLAQAQAGRSQAALARGYTQVSAPFDALVLATHVESGDLAAPGRAIATVYAPGALRAVVQMPASQAGLARTAQRIEVQLPDQRWVQPVRRADLPGADAVSQTVEWRLDLSSADAAQWLPGQMVRVRFSGTAPASAPAPAPTPTSAPAGQPQPATSAARASVPQGAVLQRGELTAVYVVQGEQFVLRTVRTGARAGGQVEILAGLKPGERIAADAVRAGLDQARPAR